MEGTDQTLERGCSSGREECPVIKVSRTTQDYRYDSPGVGPLTLEGLVRGKATVLALEAGRVMVINRDEVVAQADRAGISIICV